MSSIANGPFAGQSATARFAFDDSLIPAGGEGILFDINGLNIPEVFVSFGTESFTEANADATVLEFHGGVLEGFFLGGELNGIMAQFIGTDDFYLAISGGGAIQQEFGYTVAGDPSLTYVTTSGITYRLVSVPEPSASALAIIGLLAVAATGLRRRIFATRTD